MNLSIESFRPNRVQEIIQSTEPDYERVRKENELTWNDVFSFLGLIAFVGVLGVVCWVISLV